MTLLAIVAGCRGDAPVAAPPVGVSARPVEAVTVSAPPSVREVALAALPEKIRKRIPEFGPAPAPEPVTLPEGTAGWFSRIPTDQKVAFITIDDGWEKNPLTLKLFQAADVPVTLFLEIDAIKDDPEFFTPLQDAGATIENHTVSHPNLRGRSYDFQKREICGGADRLEEFYGRRPVLFRPPGGTYDTTTLQVVHDCGMKAAFYWKETTHKGKVRYQEDEVVKPGDIILMHFRPRFVDDYLAVLNAIHRAGLTPARLEDYVP
ncbi:polysaccharide deacetylase family protein [Actinoplanes sp. NPDC023714]|uniref:polysaccharide deacetylase family protein n=1 Tax=Actinoplanes sp. NPDC023714 TaxID=3154322 RepID=UPI0033CC866B